MVRDPRAVYASMLRRPLKWKHLLPRRFHIYCDRVADDLALEGDIPRDRYYSSVDSTASGPTTVTV